MSYKNYFSNKNDTYKDWETDTVHEKISPKFNDNDKDYYLSMKDVIEGINTSKYPLSGENVWLPDEDGNLIPLPEWIGNGGIGGGGSGGSGGAKPTKQYRVEMLSTQGNIIKDKNFTTTLRAVVYEDNVDVTAKKDKKYFKWARFSGSTEKDQIEDAKWNLKWAAGAKEIPITADDVNRNAMFQVQFVTEAQANLWVQEAYKAYIAKTNK
jgi:hypothetical protein